MKNERINKAVRYLITRKHSPNAESFRRAYFYVTSPKSTTWRNCVHNSPSVNDYRVEKNRSVSTNGALYEIILRLQKRFSLGFDAAEIDKIVRQGYKHFYGADPKYGVLTACTYKSVANTFKYWLHQRGEANPRRATLSVWAETNFTNVNEDFLDKVWGLI